MSTLDSSFGSGVFTADAEGKRPGGGLTFGVAAFGVSTAIGAGADVGGAVGSGDCCYERVQI